MDLSIENEYYKKGECFIIGCDEVGRGPLAGPVVTCSVFVKPFSKIPEILLKTVNDSKKLNEKTRKEISIIVDEYPSIVYSISEITNTEIDKNGIEKSVFDCFLKSIKDLEKKTQIQFDKILIDGNKYLPKISKEKQKPIVKGDSKVFSIALASVIAKNYRDNLMIKYSKQYPKYNFEVHKGYGTKKHFELIKKHGPCKIHRMSYYPLNKNNEK